MWSYEKRLQYPVNNPRIAGLLNDIKTEEHAHLELVSTIVHFQRFGEALIMLQEENVKKECRITCILLHIII